MTWTEDVTMSATRSPPTSTTWWRWECAASGWTPASTCGLGIWRQYRIWPGSRVAKSKFYKFCRTWFFFLNFFLLLNLLIFLPNYYLNMQIRKHLKNILYTACKWCKLCKFYVNSMVLSCGTCQMEENKCTLVKYVIYAFLLQFQFCRNLRNFSAKSFIPDFQNWQKNWLLQLCQVGIYIWLVWCRPGGQYWKSWFCLLPSQLGL